MVNRRILRVKAMQALYAFHLAEEADKEVVKLELGECYEPDLNASEVQDRDALKLNRKFALRLFNEHYENGRVDTSEEIETDMLANVNNHILRYHELIRKDEASNKKNMLHELDKIYFLYLKLLLIPQEFALLDKRASEKKESAHTSQTATGHNFYQNPYVSAFADFKGLELERIRKNVSWDNHRDQLNAWYKELRKEDKLFQEYQDKKEPTDEDHLEIINHVIKGLPFKMENMKLFMEEEDLHWSENKTIIKSMINKTLKSYDAENPEKYTLTELNKNQEEDMPFFQDLYSATIKGDKQYEEIIAKKAKNWEVGRMATLDRIILKMALAEMINFTSIPVKVSINEYIELSKKYSTPKSKQFVNGILDVMANELTSEGVIRKSGRGLIDNQ